VAMAPDAAPEVVLRLAGRLTGPLGHGAFSLVSWRYITRLHLLPSQLLICSSALS
jgi:hypothetical protein